MRSALGCLLRIFFVGIFLLLLLALAGASVATLMYYRIARSLPDIANLAGHASQFETTRILDREGKIRFLHVGKDPQDRPPDETILEEVKKLSVAR